MTFRHRSFAFLFSLLLLTIYTSCSDDNSNEDKRTDNFDRSAMLRFWADDVIIAGYEAYDIELKELISAKDAFVNDPTLSTLEVLRSEWLSAYKTWQHVAMFDIGKAEELGYRNFVNIYPTSFSKIEANIATGSYDLSLPSTFDEQGFPALDYLLYGLADEDINILNILSQENYKDYLSVLTDRLKSLNTLVLQDWKAQYRDVFVNNDGASATASTDKMVNDFLFYYEKFFRAGKIGIPAGVFTGTPMSNAVEAPYSGKFSKALFFEAFEAVSNFFVGLSYDGSTSGPSMQQYLIYIQEVNQTTDIAGAILSQWDDAETAADALMDDFRKQVQQDNTQMLTTYDEIQKAVVLLKVDMMQAFNIQVDFVDADGD